jgi:hypothetical protein
MSELNRKTMSFTDRQRDFLRAEAARLGISQADVLRRILDKLMEEKK